ncbi:MULTISPECIES: dienelactone hydrolase family protein [Rhodococcus]|uniref:Dienelactone hydrolase family protein n=1 Tax=Rhodococcus qingshengii JCM 15477 TaxID=1303681 RepID=A0AB38RAK4_RHOSG|nr:MULTISPECIES: dienelactone hydrolase family protein [Rhodococcus]MYV29892.1 dienelactone hydrolase family protein [Rhodococcus erythropolis]MBW4815520.1 dienelactone hydrolase family protein [Rhodococcus qingshengii]MBX9150158.1 dienelactone hydrolase family protein [Rhodococcus qingshengii]MCD2134251.1 dienelactone hydrolase family protein [Rhodococcus qingshengii]NDK72240.1 dienelactone hydrolase family protein [Rhodococcus qingshengii]
MVDIDLTGRAAVVGGSQPLRAILETPTTPGPWPGVVMIHEAFGLEEVMQRQAKRLAAAGFLTLAVDLYSAGGAKRCLVPTMTSMLRGHGKAFTDIEVARSWLVESTDCTGKIGVIGFCMGGGFAMVSAGDFDAASVNYGQLPRKLDEAVVDACPIVGSFGGKDFSLRGAAAKLETALSNAGIENDVKEYPTAGHAFLNDAEAGPKVLRPLERILGIGPDPVAAQDAWKRIDSFFERHLA